MGRDYEVLKRSGRDEPMWVEMHMYMVAMLGISLNSYLYLKLAKMLGFSYYFCFLFNKIGEEGRTGYAQYWGACRGGPNNLYTCK
jgi:hypothetical protein